jgi:hypothetical protein
MVERSAVKNAFYTPISLIWRQLPSFWNLTLPLDLVPFLVPNNTSARIPFMESGPLLPFGGDLPEVKAAAETRSAITFV